MRPMSVFLLSLLALYCFLGAEGKTEFLPGQKNATSKPKWVSHKPFGDTTISEVCSNGKCCPPSLRCCYTHDYCCKIMS
ncbi:unnamed protein product [Nezara viridula]|uniref:Neuropeptide n=1 Tax=Nezara viridula TaxID=85310 RepID=A0A9P0HGH0_NEZVI|nr:unnamed protein product [Nezara viridula]